MKDLVKEIRKILKKQIWLVLSTIDENNIPYSSVLIYQRDGNLIVCQTGENTLKANNIRNNKYVAITIPIRKNFIHKLLPVPPAEIHFTTEAEILPYDSQEARIIFSKYLKHTEKTELPQNSIWIKIKVPNKVTTYGIGIPLLQMRNPDKARKIVHLT